MTTEATAKTTIDPLTHGTSLRGSRSRWWVAVNGAERLVVFSALAEPTVQDKDDAVVASGRFPVGSWKDSSNSKGYWSAVVLRELAPTTGPLAAPCDDCQTLGSTCPTCQAAMTPPAPRPLSETHITTEPAPWYERVVDRLLGLDKAIEVAKELSRKSKSVKLNLDDFRVAFENGALHVESKAAALGRRFRYTLNHWSLGQICSLLSAPAAYIRRKKGDLAAENLNEDLLQRSQDVSVYRTTSEVEGIPVNTVRAITSNRYARFEDYKLLEWAKDLPYEAGLVALSDRGVSVSVYSEEIESPDVNEPVRLGLILENSEVGSSSVTAQAIIERKGLRIPITMARCRVRHVGEIKEKSYENLDASRDAFEKISPDELKEKLVEAAVEMEMTRGEWYSFLKSKGVGKHLADKVLPEGDDLVTSRWHLAVLVASRANDIPYFDTKLQAEMVASRILGV